MSTSTRTAVLVGLTALYTFAQTISLPQIFEAASVKPSSSDGGPSSTTTTKSSLVVQNAPLRICIATAFGVKPSDVEGPAWLDAERFDIVAKAPSSMAAPDIFAMYRALLGERFKLTVHPASRAEAGFALVIAKNGMKLQNLGPEPRTGMQTAQRSNPVRIMAPNGMTMKALAEELGRRLRVPVVDKTGTLGYFAVSLEYTLPDLPTESGSDGLQSQAPAAHPLIFTALQEQAGLRLESVKVSMPTVVVDSVEKKPTEN